MKPAVTLGNTVSKYFSGSSPMFNSHTREEVANTESAVEAGCGGSLSCALAMGYFVLHSAVLSISLQVGKVIQVCSEEFAALILVSRESRSKED